MIELESMALEMPEVKGHPNRRAFRGVLAMVDVPSQRPPSGAKNHLVVLTKKAAEAALPSLLGMALDYTPCFDRHDVRRKVGVITRAEIVGRNLEVGGYLFARDFPEIVEEMEKSRPRTDCSSLLSLSSTRSLVASMHAIDGSAGCSLTKRHGIRASLQAAATQLLELTAALSRLPQNRQGRSETPAPTIRADACPSPVPAGLGLSYEVANVELADTRARIWILNKVTFTGAAILRRDKAAYRDTWIELSS